MKTTIAAFVLILLAAGPTFAANPAPWQLRDGSVQTFVPFSGGHSLGPDFSTTSREGLVRAH
jgi:hypothetical protein